MAVSGFYGLAGSTYYKWIGVSSLQYNIFVSTGWARPSNLEPYRIYWYRASNGAMQYSQTNAPFSKTANEGFFTSATENVWPAPYRIYACQYVNVSVSVTSGFGSVSGGGTNIIAGVESVRIYATAFANSKFSAWSDGNTSASRQFQPDGDISLSATFVRSHYLVTVIGQNSTAMISPASPIVAGSSFTINCQPHEHYSFSKWVGSDGSSIYTQSATLVATKDITYTAQMVQSAWQVKTSASPGDKGYTVIDGYGSATSAWFQAGDTVTVKAFPNDVSKTKFLTWKRGDLVVSFFDVFQFVMGTSNVTLVAEFIERSYGVTVNTEGGWGQASVTTGDVTNTTSEETPEITVAAYWNDNPCVLEAVPDEHGVFKKWVDENDEEYTEPKLFLHFTDTDNHTFTAVFAEARLFDLTLAIDETGQPVTGEQNSIFIEEDNGQSEGQFYEGYIKVSAMSVQGWRLRQWNITGLPSIQFGDKDFDSSIRFMLERDTVVSAFFELNRYDVRWVIDEPSEDHGSIFAEYRLNDSEEFLPYDYEIDAFFIGSQLRLTAQPVGSDVLVEWALVDGTVYSTADTITITIEEDISLVAKFGSIASATIVGTSTESTVAVEPELFAYGEEVTFSAYIAEGEYFKGWHLDSVLQPALPAEFTVKPESAVVYEAKIDVTPDPFYVMLTNEVAGFGVINLISDDAELMTASSDWRQDAEDIFGVANFVQNKYYKFNGVSKAVLSASATLPTVSFSHFNFIPMLYIGGEWIENTVETTEVDRGVQIVLSQNSKLRAMYLSAVETTIALRHVVGSSGDMGVLGFSVPGSNPVSGTVVQADFIPGTKISIVAMPKSGHVFVGWFNVDSGLGISLSTSTEYEISVTSGGATYYAKFERDSSMIYEWEGEMVNKQMQWFGKRHVSRKPFAPVAAIIDADGYPLEFKVAMASSPDSKLSREIKVDMHDKLPRRLPQVRPEKYFIVGVTSLHTVNEIAVGTSMGGLR